MQIYEVRNPDLEMFVQYKVLAPAEIEATLDSRSSLTKDQYRKLILEAIIYNLSDVLEKLKDMPKDEASRCVVSLYNGCVMLNPGIDVENWISLTGNKTPAYEFIEEKPVKKTRKKSTKLTKVKFLNLERHLKSKIIGQDQAIDELVKALKRAYVGLNDADRPYGIFLFAGASGVGKTSLARELHKYLYGDDYDLIRIDCGEYQHKHENSKLIGSPPGYVGYDEGGQLTKQVLEHPRSVILLDEIEKAHPDMFHTFLRVFDEGCLTDGAGKVVSFKESIIILTTNLGNKEVVSDLLERRVGFNNGEVKSSSFERRGRLTMEAIRKHFPVEFINRIDNIVVFNHLNHEDFCKIAALEIERVDQKLSKSGYSLQVDDSVLEQLASLCENSVENARRISQVRRDEIESRLADYILAGKFNRGTIFSITYNEKEKFKITG